jgi:hypothetical protein
VGLQIVILNKFFEDAKKLALLGPVRFASELSCHKDLIPYIIYWDRSLFIIFKPTMNSIYNRLPKSFQGIFLYIKRQTQSLGTRLGYLFCGAQ